MNRRTFVEIFVGGLIGSQFLGCDKNPKQGTKKQMNIDLPEFSKANLHHNLDRLLKAFESKGMKVDDALLPAISESTLRERCSWFPGELTQEIIALYGWRGGQNKDAWESEYPFWFRDNSFCSIERAEIEYKGMMEGYGTHPPDYEMLKYSFPIASFNDGLYAIPTKGHTLDSVLEHPILSVHEGIDIFFYSIEKMVETCVEWVEHENYSPDGLYPGSLEREIWRKHNPGIFS